MTAFFKLYGHYKDQWDVEMRLWKANLTYGEWYAQSQKSEEWF